MTRTLFTIGHSNHKWSKFLSLLQLHDVTAVADVRSQPFSRLPHFRRDQLESSLSEANIQYVFLGRELGGRRSESECYEGSVLSYERVAQLPAFVRGLERLKSGMDSHRVAMLCAEQDPLNCHRTLLICRNLRLEPFNIQHILGDGQLESQSAMEQRLVKLTGETRTLLEPDLTEEDLIQRAYSRQGKRTPRQPVRNV